MKNFNCKLIDVNNDKFLTEWNAAVVPDIGDKIKLNDSETLFVVQRKFNVKDKQNLSTMFCLRMQKTKPKS